MQYKYKCVIGHQACFIYADVQSEILCYALFCTKPVILCASLCLKLVFILDKLMSNVQKHTLKFKDILDLHQYLHKCFNVHLK